MHRFFVPRLLLSLAFLAFPFSTLRADWLQYRGPQGNGASSEKSFNPSGANAPKILWRAQLGKGTSSVTVEDGRAYTLGNTEANDILYCLDARSGHEVWRHSYPIALDPNMFEGGPRSTPTLDGKLLYSVSHQGDLFCLEAATGAKVWYKHYQKDFGGRRPSWGYAGSPTVSGNLLICDVGAADGSTVALEKATGKVVWKSGSDGAGYATPLVSMVAGRPTVVLFKAEALFGLDLKTGQELWRSPWKTSYDINAASPLLIGSDRLFISSGYNAGCALLQISAGKAVELWRNKNLRSHFNSPVAHAGAIFGIDGNAGGGNLVCLDAGTGERKWEERSVKGGSLLLANGKLLICSEKGELIIADASPTGFHALSRGHVLDHRCWTQPTLDAGRLFLRDNEGDLACVDISAP